MRNTFDVIIGRLDVIEEKISEPDQKALKTTQNETEEKKTIKIKKISMVCGATSKSDITTRDNTCEWISQKRTGGIENI